VNRKKTEAPAAAAVAAKHGAYRTLGVAERDHVAFVTLDRPDVHNAFDDELIRELTAALVALEAAPNVRAIVLQGAGETFCAGADLNWMRRMAGYTYEENVADAEALARLLETLYAVSKPTVARIHGAAYGGGVGLIACCDIAVAVPEASFALSEVRLGLIPSTIGPYVIEAIGVRQARRYMLSGERFGAAEAHRIGLVHEVVPATELDGRVDDILGSLLLAGPRAQAAAKALVRAVAHRPIDRNVTSDTVARIATIRATDEAREGMAAFLTRRSAAWVPATLRRGK